MVYSFFLIRMYVSFRQEVSKGGFPTRRVYLGISRQKGVSFAKATQIVHRSDHFLSTPRGFPGRGNTALDTLTAMCTVPGSCPLEGEAGI